MKIDLGGNVVIDFGDIPIIRGGVLPKTPSSAFADSVDHRKERKAVMTAKTSPCVHFLVDDEDVV